MPNGNLGKCECEMSSSNVYWRTMVQWGRYSGVGTVFVHVRSADFSPLGHLLFTCRSRFVHMSFIYHSHVIHVWFIYHSHVIHVRFICHSHVIHFDCLSFIHWSLTRDTYLLLCTKAGLRGRRTTTGLTVRLSSGRSGGRRDSRRDALWTRYNVINCYRGYDLTFIAGMEAQGRGRMRERVTKSWKNTVKELHFWLRWRSCSKVMFTVNELLEGWLHCRWVTFSRDGNLAGTVTPPVLD